MIGTHEMRQAGRLVDPFRSADEERHTLEITCEVRHVVCRIRARNNERLHLAARQLCPKIRKLDVASLALVGRPFQVKRGSVCANCVVDKIAEHLDADVLARRDDQPTTQTRNRSPIASSSGSSGEGVTSDSFSPYSRFVGETVPGKVRDEVTHLARPGPQTLVRIRSSQ